MNRTTRLIGSNRCVGLLIISAFLIAYAGLRPIGLDPDSQNYADLFERASTDFEFFEKEPLFWLILFCVRDVFSLGADSFFLVFAILGVGVKLYAISRLSINIWFGVFCYVLLYFFLHEYTQIRAGVASGLFLLSLGDVVYNKRSAFLFKNILASCFHYTGLIGFLAWFLRPDKLNRRFYLSLPVIGLMVGQMPVFDVAILFLPEFLGQKIQIYTQLFDEGFGARISLFNLNYIFYLIVYYLAVSFSGFLKTDIDLVLVKVFGFSLFSFYAFSFLPVFSFRISEYLGVVIVVLLPNMARMFREKLIYCLVVALCLIPIFLVVSVSKILMVGAI